MGSKKKMAQMARTQAKKERSRRALYEMSLNEQLNAESNSATNSNTKSIHMNSFARSSAKKSNLPP
jgi:hypothetical protein